MTLAPHEFIRRLLLHCLPDGFHRIRHYGFHANGIRCARLAVIKRLYGRPPRGTVQFSARLTGRSGAGMYTGFSCGAFMPLALMKSADRIPDRSTRF